MSRPLTNFVLILFLAACNKTTPPAPTHVRAERKEPARRPLSPAEQIIPAEPPADPAEHERKIAAYQQRLDEIQRKKAEQLGMELPYVHVGNGAPGAPVVEKGD